MQKKTQKQSPLTEVIKKGVPDKKRIAPWVRMGISISLLAAVIFSLLYGYFTRNMDDYYGYNPVETEENIGWVYQNSYLLYRDLYNKMNHTSLSYVDLYMEGLKEQLEAPDQNGDDQDAEEWDEEYHPVQARDVKQSLYHTCESYFNSLEDNFSALNENYDYLIRDTKTGDVITNLTTDEVNLDDQHFYLSFEFDENGMVSVGKNIMGTDVTRLRKYASEVTRSYTLHEIWKNWLNDYNISSIECRIRMPQNCQIIYCIDKQTWARLQKEGTYVAYQPEFPTIVVWHRLTEYEMFTNTGSLEFLLVFIGLIVLGAFFLPGVGRGEPWNARICRLPLEILLILGFILLGCSSLLLALALAVCNGDLVKFFQEMMPWLVNYFNYDDFFKVSAAIFNIAALAFYFFCFWYIGVSLRAMRTLRIRRYIKERCLLYRIFPYVKRRVKRAYEGLTHLDVTVKADRSVRKIVLSNALILLGISSLWVGGFALTVIYSIILYFVLRKYISDLQKKYGLLLQATNQIAEGDLNVSITEDLGIFEPFKPQIIRIQKGFQKALEEETKSQRMKAELITNVSHDLKTPLTAIITYIGLLKDEKITQEQRSEYLDTLEKKALRLKVLIEDLFEVSKAHSQNMALDIMDVDMGNLVKQACFELSEKLEAAKLDVRMNLPDEKVILPLDSQKTYRIFENLFGNIAKYALHGTRVYVDLTRNEERVIVTLKNITANEITVNAEELTERFVRGDASRNTEGSGLGLAIAKSFMELQGGELFLEIDGDLFKASTVFPAASSAQT